VHDTASSNSDIYLNQPTHAPAHAAPTTSHGQLGMLLHLHRYVLSFLPEDVLEEAADFTEALEEYVSCGIPAFPSAIGDSEAAQRKQSHRKTVFPSTTASFLHAKATGQQIEQAMIPHIDSDIHLDSAGKFIKKRISVYSHPTIKRGSSARKESLDMEDSVMDSGRCLSFREITSDEKRDVFNLSSVRRSMR
jgi:hypothetical protein